MSHIIISSNARYSEYVSSHREFEFKDAMDFTKSVGRPYIFKSKDVGDFSVFEFRYLNDEIHASIDGSYYLSETHIPDDIGISKFFRIDFDNPDDAIIFKLAWL